jgi:hypothetical protein
MLGIPLHEIYNQETYFYAQQIMNPLLNRIQESLLLAIATGTLWGSDEVNRHSARINIF